MTAPTVSSHRALALRPVHPAGWWPDVAMAVGFIAVTAALAWSPVRELDLALRDVADAHRPAWAEAVTIWLHRLGSGGLLTAIALIIALVLGWRRRSAWPVAPVLAAFALTGLVIMPIKWFAHRAAPHS
ncbi:MAG TPA: PA-phosphatase, partial [Micromonosporaceae bacterium]